MIRNVSLRDANAIVYIYLSLIHICSYFTSISFPEKHVREFPKTRTTFRKNMYVFRRKHYDVFYDSDFQPLANKTSFSAYCKILLIQGYPEKKE